MHPHIVIINQNSGYLMIDIANQFADNNNEVTLLAGRIIERDKPLCKTIKTDKLIAYNRSSAFKRLFTWIWVFLQIVIKINFKYRKTFLFIVTNPPFAILLPLFCKNKYSILVYDVYPDALTESKILNKNSWLVKQWQKANTKVYAGAEKLFTISEGMRATMEKYAQGKIIEVVPVWTDNNFLKPVAKEENPFVTRHNLQNEFIVLYSGNLGLTHNVEVIPEIASRIKNPNIFFLIIGEGDKKRLIEEKIAELKLNNCMLLPFQDTMELPWSLSSADIAIVTLGKESSHLSIPSKTYNLMSVGAPLLCIASEDSELSSLVSRHEIGKSFQPIQIEEIIEFILKLEAEPLVRKRYSDNALKASLLYTSENAKRFVD